MPSWYGSFWMLALFLYLHHHGHPSVDNALRRTHVASLYWSHHSLFWNLPCAPSTHQAHSLIAQTLRVGPHPWLGWQSSLTCPTRYTGWFLPLLTPGRAHPSLWYQQALHHSHSGTLACLALRLPPITTPLQASLVPVSPWEAAEGTWSPRPTILGPGRYRKLQPQVLAQGPGSTTSSLHGGATVTSSVSLTGTRSMGAADLSSREVSVLDAHSQAGDGGEAFDFFEQQDRAEGEGLPLPGLKAEDAERSSEEEEALDPLGIMR